VQLLLLVHASVCGEAGCCAVALGFWLASDLGSGSLLGGGKMATQRGRGRERAVVDGCRVKPAPVEK